MKSAMEKAKLMAEDAGSSESADSSDESSESAGQEGVKARTARNKRNRLSNRDVGKAAGANLWKVARSATDTILARTTDLEARRRIVEMVQKQVLQPAESEQIRLGCAIFKQLKQFKPWVEKQVVNNEDKEVALRAAQMATLPPKGEGMGKLYSTYTGFNSKGFDDIRKRRADSMPFHAMDKGLYRKTVAPRGKLIPLEETKLAIKVWHEETAPRALGAGEYNKV